MLSGVDGKNEFSIAEHQQAITENTEKMRKFIKMGLNSSVLLLSLIEDILDLSKIDSGTFKANISEFNVNKFIDEIYDIFSFQCNQKKLNLNIFIDGSMDNFELKSDRGRIKQVLLNLLSNSLKFTFDGSIAIGLTKLSINGKSFAEFSVRDTGIGIK